MMSPRDEVVKDPDHRTADERLLAFQTGPLTNSLRATLPDPAQAEIFAEQVVTLLRMECVGMRVPGLSGRATRRRDALIYDLKARGYTVANIAERFSIKRRTVYKACKRELQRRRAGACSTAA